MAESSRGNDWRGEGRARHFASRLRGGVLLVAGAIIAGAYLLRRRANALTAAALELPVHAFVPQATRPDELEGWGVRWRVAVLGAAGVFIFIAVTLAGAFAFYEHAGAPTVATRPDERFPEPTLNARLDRDPAWSFAPPEQQIRDPDPQVRAAMNNLAAQGDAAYDTSGRTP